MAYTPQRIRDYIDEVKRDGLSEHGFPRLTVNIGVLIAYGRRRDLMEIFLEMMDLCCEEIPKRKAANDFSIREVCYCMMLLEERKTVDAQRLAGWKARLRSFDPWTGYDKIAQNPEEKRGNWTLFVAVSEYLRWSYCGVDTSEFVDLQLATQVVRLDEYGMYQDAPPLNPIVYDLVPRGLMATLLLAGYKGKFAKRLEDALDRSADLHLHMQSVTGELAFGGRSNQFLHNEAWLAAYGEMEAVRYARKGDFARAGAFKASARLAAEKAWEYLSLDPISHIKNRYDVSTRFGCEGYGYFNKYMITVASFFYMALLHADESIKPTLAPAEKGGYIAQTGKAFRKVFLNCGGYFLEFETDADLRHDANGLGRVHKKGCPSMLCLSVPFPGPDAKYLLDVENPRPMALGCVGGAEVPYTFMEGKASDERVTAVFRCEKGEERYAVSQRGVEITYGQKGFYLPVFAFDGEKEVFSKVEDGKITVEYQGAVCTYTFDGTIAGAEDYRNRNGIYRVYRIEGEHLHIQMEPMKKKLGLVSVSFRKNSPEEILAAMQKAELSFIEWGSDVHCPPEKAEAIAALQKKYQISCCSYGTYFDIGNTPLEKLPDYIKAAKTLGTEILRLWAGKGKEYTDYSAEEKKVFFEECRKCAEIGEKEGVVLCLECHKGTFTDCKEGALELMEAVNSPHFRMYWQPHQDKEVEENLAYARLLAPYTENLHVFNWKGKEKMPLGEAVELWREYLSFFEGERFLLLEFMPDGRLESLAAEAEALRRIAE